MNDQQFEGSEDEEIEEITFQNYNHLDESSQKGEPKILYPKLNSKVNILPRLRHLPSSSEGIP